jgi:hypothetical protein
LDPGIRREGTQTDTPLFSLASSYFSPDHGWF